MDSSLLGKLGPFGRKYIKKGESYVAGAGASKGNPLTKILNVAIAKKAASSGYSKPRGGTTRTDTGTATTAEAAATTATTTGRITRSKVLPKQNGTAEVNPVRARPPSTKKNVELYQKRSQQITTNENQNSKPVPQKPNVPKAVIVKVKQDKQVDNKPPVAAASVKKTILVPPATVGVVKKLKPKGIDCVFTEHNSNFAKACETLTHLEKYWKEAVQAPDIPEDIRDDIIAALGKIKLLLGSKLPQFSQLLYSYICKEMDPGPILECDLQGWWDVASIQLEAIQKEFKTLLNLQGSNWIKNNVEPSELKTRTKMTNENRTPRKPKTANASKGMREFLAMKRKANDENNTSETNSSNSDQTPKKSMVESVVNKTFDGGFFVINSPLRKVESSIV